MTLEEQAAQMQREVVALLAKNQTYQSKIKVLEEQIAWFKRQMYGKKSERHVPGERPEQCKIFELPAKPAEEQKEEIRSHTRRRKQITSQDEQEAPEGTFPEHLRRVELPIEYKPAGYTDAELEILSYKITERLAEEPGDLYVKKYIRTVYKVKRSGEPLNAPAPEHIFGRCKVDESFLVLMAIRKFLWHLPLYRQEQMLKLEGMELRRESFARWMINLAELFNPIAQAINDLLRKQQYLHIDNTPGTVGFGSHKAGKSYEQAYFWPLLHPEIGVYFAFSADKSYRSFETLIKDFKGTIVSDAEDIFEKYVRANELRWQLCWMHSRRNFFEAQKSSPDLAGKALEYIKELYEVERAIKEQRILDPTKISRYRSENSVPILEEFRKWLRKTQSGAEALTDNLLAKAINYLYSRWEAAILYISDGSLPMDNGADERVLRPLKLGFKNYLFCASEIGAKAAATFYTLIHSAKMQGVHPYYYLLDLCKRIEQPGLTATDLVPHKWSLTYLIEAVPKHLQAA